MRSNKKKDNDTNDDDTSIWALATVGLIGAAIGNIIIQNYKIRIL